MTINKINLPIFTVNIKLLYNKYMIIKKCFKKIIFKSILIIVLTKKLRAYLVRLYNSKITGIFVLYLLFRMYTCQFLVSEVLNFCLFTSKNGLTKRSKNQESKTDLNTYEKFKQELSVHESIFLILLYFIKIINQ